MQDFGETEMGDPVAKEKFWDETEWRGVAEKDREMKRFLSWMGVKKELQTASFFSSLSL